MDPEEIAVNEAGASTTPAAPATDVNDTQLPNLDPVASMHDDDFDDIDDAHADQIKKAFTEDDKDEEDELKPVEKPTVEKPADKPTAGESATDNPVKGATDTDTKEQPVAAPAADSAKESRIEQLTREIAELRTSIGVEPNADIRSLVAEKNLLQEISATQIKRASIELETKLLDMTNPDTEEPYTPDEAHLMAQRAAIEAQGEQESHREYELNVQRNQSVLQSDTQRALTEFPIFVKLLPGIPPKLADGLDNPAAINPKYDPVAAELAGNQINDTFTIGDTGKKDKDGKPIMGVIGAKRSPYEIMKSVAETTAKYKTQAESQREADKAEAEAKAATALSKQANGADVPVSGNTGARTKDPGADFDEAFDSYDA